MPNLVGIGLSQVPTNSMLGGLAYQDPEHASIKNLDLKNLSQINSEIADTAVDVFVYDTSKDSDGGAWRKRTTHTSWYNETLGTATRGSRKEFPAVAVIVAESTQVTIYDGDDPDLPMWMVFTQTGDAGNVATQLANSVNATVSSVYMLNGILCVGFDSTSQWGVSQIKFTSDSQEFRWTSGIYILPSANNIAKRNVSSGWIAYDTTTTNIGYGNAIVNDVAMTVLPNAPIDSATGLPVPTIAVATEGGVSIIKDDGNVYDIVYTGNTKTVSVAFNTSGNLHFVQHDNDVQFVNVPVPTQDYANGTAATLVSSTGGSAYHTGNDISGNTQSAILGDVVNDTLPNATSGTSGLTFISNETPTGFLQGAVAYATTSYNTGWMHGDIKGAFLSDTDTTNVTVGSAHYTETFTGSGDNTWGVAGSATISGGVLTLANAADSRATDLTAASSLTTGQKYIAEIEIVTNTSQVFKLDDDGSGAEEGDVGGG